MTNEVTGFIHEAAEEIAKIEHELVEKVEEVLGFDEKPADDHPDLAPLHDPATPVVSEPAAAVEVAPTEPTVAAPTDTQA